MAVKIHLPTESDNVRIEMLPLIDVVFCILTFFILAAVSLTRQQAITLNLPKASTSQAQLQKMFVVSIDPAGQLFVDKDPVNRSELYQRLATYLKTHPEGLVILRASQVVSYNEVIQVLDLLRSLGGNRVALATQPVERPVLSTEAPPSSPNPLPSLPANEQPLPSNP
ncbi:ExbD/TolR family protein [Thermosynechococcus vestitus]|uniref:Tlr0055 protein n=1 Tax=Thermosynechococcus vestitus (strain NIES-2133 / IAM M-273 / BP-1) TaxID=197221 RepID=Q8DMQ6_THEVB|nr:tlr0055 [Thermosynechococcus vestitus BP-1]